MIVVRAGKPELALPVEETRSGVRLVLAKILDAKSTFLLAFQNHDELFFACWLHRIKFAGKDQGKSCTLKRVFYQRLTVDESKLSKTCKAFGVDSEFLGVCLYPVAR